MSNEYANRVAQIIGNGNKAAANFLTYQSAQQTTLYGQRAMSRVPSVFIFVLRQYCTSIAQGLLIKAWLAP